MARLCSDSSRPYPGRSAWPVAQAASMAHPVKRPAGATGIPSPGNRKKASRPRLRQETKRAVQDGHQCKRRLSHALSANRQGNQAEVSRGHSSQTPGVMPGTR